LQRRLLERPRGGMVEAIRPCRKRLLIGTAQPSPMRAGSLPARYFSQLPVLSTGGQPVNSAGNAVELEGIVKRFGSMTAVERMDLSITEGSFVTLLGPSGCGKTTTLRIIAGLLDPSEG